MTNVNPKTVAIIGTRGYPSYYGGFETAVRKIAPAFADAGWDVVVYGRKGATLLDDPTLDPRITRITTRGFERKSISTLSYGFTAALHAFRTKPDAVLVMNVANGFFLPLLRARDIPTIINVDGIEWDRAKWGKLAKSVFRLGARLTAKFGDELVFDSKEIARRWNIDFERGGVFIPYGGETVSELPLEPGLNHRGYVLLVARFVPENTVPEFFEAAERISQNIPVVIVGSSGYGGPLEVQIQELVSLSSKITWLGHISDDARLLALWQHAAVYFHGHSVGGTNPTLVQAMAAGTPIVARDTPYNREVLPEGTPFFQPTVESITDTVLALSENATEQRELSEKNMERARTFYDWESVCAAYVNTTTQLLKINRAAPRLHK